ncbi:MAG: hypothetical protein ABSB14_17005 [Candidatus Sulfotelmatobacter sp.]
MPNFPNRCQHLKVNGTQCGSPALRRNRFCYFHKLHQEQRITLGTDQARRNRNLTITLPVLEDANSIQVTLMQVMRLIIAGQIDGKQAGLVLYALQTASSNLARTSFEPYRHDIVLDPKAVNQTALGSHVWEDEDFPDNQEEANDEAADPDDPRPNFTPRTPQEARNKAEMSRWSEAEADRLQALGKLQHEAERQAELREDRIEAERQQAEEEAIEAVARQNASRSAAAVTPAGRAILPPQPTAQPPAKHPPAKATIGEVREKVNAQIRKALPAIAAAVRQNSGHNR